ncbi:phospholipase C, phosphocholine-specific [Lichenicola cladoniae]|uniref:phospholipase C n=1 Tax=Lichenicola cladoniae TaxID=1484109 RepID=A0A6M8HS24_9PROT|nr:phospholipase C, phosphocholine-specific [Lichenicola cladoniae]NPD65680.1 phospholipase C, phosphocholine-specific [Acetobacteraceae bacterium]QKE91293.1 phospholipase C, phosphocholine-specific [Lichenicola cladoniae]
MQDQDRRSFLRLMGAGAVAATLQESIGKALALPANDATRSINDVEHIVILMQENRSFDHYYGSMSGVRGFNDPRAIQLPGGNPVWYQPNGAGYLLPFRPTGDSLGLSFIGDTPHDWNSTQRAWNDGNWNDWVAQKTTATMVYFNRGDIPFHYALADAFTICDAYHCSVMGPTYPNRAYMFTGWTGNDGQGNGPQLDTNALICNWPTYPERLEAAGLSWKIYQDTGSGLTAANNWGDDPDHYVGNSANNTLLRFVKYQNAADTDPLAIKARTGTNITASGTLFDILQKDVDTNTLPQISWLMCPNAYDEHPNWPANYGAWFISKIIDTLTSNPEVWSKTALFVTYDENDGFFDHMVPPAAPPNAAQGQSTVSVANEIFAGNATHDAGPFGMGPRVPMLVVSPWSKGGWVNSEVFDHTSLIRFIEARHAGQHPGLIEPNITPWRRAVSGDLTSAFDFKNPNAKLPSLPSTAAYLPPDKASHPNTPITLPTNQVLPRQEHGIRRARALPYNLHVSGGPDQHDDALHLTFANTGKAGAVFQVRDLAGGTAPRFHTVEPGKQIQDSWPAAASRLYDLSVHGPNGFFRSFKGNLAGRGWIAASAEADPLGLAFVVRLTNRCLTPLHVQIENMYSKHTTEHLLFPVGLDPILINLAPTSGWYDITIRLAEDSSFLWRIAGHVENGRDSITDPEMGLAST